MARNIMADRTRRCTRRRMIRPRYSRIPHNVPNMARMTERTTVKATLGRMPLPKRSAYERPPVHSGMTMKSRRTGVHYQAIGGDEMSRFDANGPSPLSGAPRGKRVAPVAVNPGCRDRSRCARIRGGGHGARSRQSRWTRGNARARPCDFE